MPETATLRGVDDPFEPMESLHGAARYLTAQFADFGRLDWALAAYNADPRRASQFHGVPPFRETRDCVAKIPAGADVGGAVVEGPQRGDAQASAPPRSGPGPSRPFPTGPHPSPALSGSRRVSAGAGTGYQRGPARPAGGGARDGRVG